MNRYYIGRLPCGFVICGKDFDLRELLESYDHHEVFDVRKDYNINPFEFDYGYGIRRYRYAKIRLISNHHVYDDYVVAEELLEDRSKSMLMRYCQCYKCTSSWFNINSYFGTYEEAGCLKTDYYNQKQIRAARNYIHLNGIVIG